MEASIILSGRAPDILGNMGRGMQLGMARADFDRQNALAAAFRQYGAGAIQGDQTALNALAAYDPTMAMNLSGARLGQQATRLGLENDAARLDLARQQARLQAEEYARQRDAATLAADRDELSRDLRGLAYYYAQGDVEGFNGFLAQTDADESMGVTFDNFPAVAAMAGDVLETWQGFLPPQPEYTYQGDQWWQQSPGQPPVAVSPPQPSAPVWQDGQWWDVQPGQVPAPLTQPRPPSPEIRDFGGLPYAVTPQSATPIPGVAPPAPERGIREDPNGIPRYVDDGSEVFPGVTPPGYEALSDSDARRLGLDPSGVYMQRDDGMIVVVQDPTGTAEPTAAMRNYQFLVDQGVPQDEAMERAFGGGGTTVNVGPSESAFSTETAKVLAQEANEIARQGALAQRNLGQVAVLEDALARAPQGAAGGLARLASAFGIPFEGRDDMQVAEAIISQLVPQQRPPGSGTMSDADIALFRASLPRLSGSPEGNRRIVQTLRAIAEYDVARGNIARRVQLGEISPAQATQEYAALGNPIPPDLRGGTSGAPAPAAAAPASAPTAPPPAARQTLSQEEVEALSRVQGAQSQADIDAILGAYPNAAAIPQSVRRAVLARARALGLY